MFSLQHVFDSIRSPALVHTIGWLLMHSLWQFSLIAIAALVFGQSLRSQSATKRYWMLICAMFLTVLSTTVTWCIQPMDREVLDDANVLVLSNEMSPISGILAQAGEELSSQPSLEEKSPTVPQQVHPISALQRGWSLLGNAINPWLSVVVALWCCGVILLSLRLMSSWLTVRRLRQLGIAPVAEFVVQALNKTQNSLKVTRPVEVLASSLVSAPLVIGCFRSVILLPASFISSVPVSQLEAILAHELAHVRRYDYLVNMLQTFMETVFFYHPAVWWLSHRIRVERENCCDDLVVEALDNKVEYGRALLAVEQYRGQNGSSLALSARDGSLLTRVRRLLADPAETSQRNSGGAAFLATMATALAIILLSYSTLVLGQDESVQDESVQAESLQAESVQEGFAQNEPRLNERKDAADNAVAPGCSHARRFHLSSPWLGEG
jgi:beta-lactamase regulating signal transducer with metallopeptidase domain